MFLLAPHPKPERPLRGSPRMFRVDWIEKYFSRVRPWHIVVLWVPFALWCLWQAVTTVHEHPVTLTLLIGVGVLGWTLSEYLLHRFLFHFKADEKSKWQPDAAYLIHGIHHDYPWDGDRLVMPPFAGAVICVFLWMLVHLVLGDHTYAFFTGMVSGYLWYDLTHYYVHHAKPRTPLGKWLRKYHMLHHFSGTHARYGITTPLWDHVFRTYPQEQERPAEDVEAHA